MADRAYPETNEIVGRYVGEDICLDVILSECLRVLFEPQSAQPISDIHLSPLRSVTVRSRQHYTKLARKSPRAQAAPRIVGV